MCVACACLVPAPRSLRLCRAPRLPGAAPDPDRFVNLMMVDELGLQKWDPQAHKGMWKQGAITMFSFWFFGGIPVVTYAVVSAAGVASQNLIFLIDCLVTLLTMFLLGAAKAKVGAVERSSSTYTHPHPYPSPLPLLVPLRLPLPLPLPHYLQFACPCPPLPRSLPEG